MADDKGRRPGLYTILAGAPNNWPKSTVDFNLRQLPHAAAEAQRQAAASLQLLHRSVAEPELKAHFKEREALMNK